MFTSLCILGRQPGLGLVELESLFGSDAIQPIDNNAALLDIATACVPFSRLGGTIKLCKVLTVIDTTNWGEISSFLNDFVLRQIADLSKGKIKLGLSLYGLDIPVKQISAAGLSIKKAVKTAGRSARVVPNTTSALNSAQVLHNQLTGPLGIELVFVRDNNILDLRKARSSPDSSNSATNGFSSFDVSSDTSPSEKTVFARVISPWKRATSRKSSKTIIAQTVAEQDIVSYTLRDRGRPKRDARVGMLPPKFAQIITNLAIGVSPVTSHPSSVTRLETGDKRLGSTKRPVLLDPYCGTGVLLQEAMLMGINTYGTDIDPRMIEYSETNLQWLDKTYNLQPITYNLMQGDATSHHWTKHFDAVATETYLGRPFTSPPDDKMLATTVNDCNVIIKKFLANIANQIKTGTRLCLAIPAWHVNGNFKHLPLLDSLTDMGYTRLSFVHADNNDLVYYREGQIVARELIVLVRL